MRVILFIAISLTFYSGVSYGQNISVEELIVFQTSKNPVRIDSILLTKKKWDCNCIRKFDDIKRNTEWIYDAADTVVESVKKDHVKVNHIGNGFGSITKYLTSDKTKGEQIIAEMQKKRLSEEKINILSNDSINAKISFYVAQDVVIQTMVAENKKRNLYKYIFILMDKSDYKNGLTIK